MKNRLRWMVRDDEGFLEDEIPRNKSRHQKDTRDDTMDTREPMRFKWCFISVENKTQKNIIE